MPQLDTLTFSSQIFWLIISFSLMCYVLTKVYVPKLGRAIQARRQKLMDDRSRSAKFNDESRALLEANSTKLLNARAEAAKVLRRTVQEVAHEKTHQLQGFDESLAKKAKTERGNLFAERRDIEGNLDKLVTGAVALAVEKIFQVDIKEAEITKVVAKTLQEESNV